MVEARWATGTAMAAQHGVRETRRTRSWRKSSSRLPACRRPPDPTKIRSARSSSCATALRRYARTWNHSHSNAWEKTELARHPQRPYPLDYIERIFTDWSETPRRSRLWRTIPRIICGMARFHGEEVMIVGTSEGSRYQAEGLPQLRHAQPGGLPQGHAGDEDCGKIWPSVVYFCGHTGRLSRPGRGRARPGGGHRAQPARDGSAAGSDRHHDYGRRWKRRRAGDCRRRPRADDGELRFTP